MTERERFEAWWDTYYDHRVRRGLGPYHHALAAWDAALAQRTEREPVAAWRERDGDEWVYYGPGSSTFDHITNHQKDRHGVSIFPLYAAPPLDDEGMRLLRKVSDKLNDYSGAPTIQNLVRAINAYLAKHPK